MIKLVLTDMDDTLIPAGHDGASDYAIEGIHAMQAAGLHFGPVLTKLNAPQQKQRCGHRSVNRAMFFLDLTCVSTFKPQRSISCGKIS